MPLKTTRSVTVIKRSAKKPLTNEDEAVSQKLKTPAQVQREIAGIVLSWVSQRKESERSEKKSVTPAVEYE